MADKKRLQGIALILFGILLCLAEEEINRELFHSIGYFPFALIGAITGIAGLVMVFHEKVGIGNLAGIVLVLGSIAVMNMELPISGKSMPKRVSVTSQEHAHVQ